MRITTTRFGCIDVEASDLIRFPSGMPGLEDCREWALLADASNDALAVPRIAAGPPAPRPALRATGCTIH